MKRLNALLILALLPACASAQEQPGPVMRHAPEQPRIQVTTTGTVRRAPDQAVVRLAVETVATTAREAARENASKMERIIAALRRLDIPRDRIQTTGYFMHPEYRHDEERREPQIIGYRVTNILTVTVDGPERAGGVIDAALDAGANRVDGLEFGLKGVQSARSEALRDAMEKARAEAQTLASAAGLTLGEPIVISTGSVVTPYPRPEMMMRAEAMGGDVSTPVEPGRMQVMATVEVHYAARRER